MTFRNPEHCPKCGGNGTRVVESRKATTHRWRRRKCTDCAQTWRTYESIINPERVTTQRRQTAT